MAELKTGTVYLVGAGPGDPALLTVRAQEVIATADAVLYDRLIPDGALDGAREHAELVYVGKEPGGSVQQRDIGAELVARAKRGQTVVRLKGGDPFVFGRGGEEAEVLRAAGIRYEVVPGITAGIAAPAYAGIPVTHRDAPARSPSSPVTRIPTSRSRCWIGRRWHASRARSSSTWASRPCRGSPTR